MSNLDTILSRVRRELDDPSRPFRDSYRGTGDQTQFDLPVERIDSLTVFTVATSFVTNDPDSATPNPTSTTTLLLGTDYTADYDNGFVTLTTPLAEDQLMIAQGTAFGLFTDAELTDYINDALLQHIGDRRIMRRYRDDNGFIKYDRSPITVNTLNEVEFLPVAMLATVEALWSLSTSAALDIDVITSEGTHIPRSQRFQQVQEQITFLMGQYQMLCAMLGVGLFRIEISNLRRVSSTTNRLVPLFVEREYDETYLPTRIVPNVDSRDADWDGPPNPAQNMGMF